MGENAITKSTGPCIIMAGAGTGKTYTIIEKLNYLISNNVYTPERIVCLTFSNEAVASLKSRIMHTNVQGEPIIRTFHSFCADILKEHGTLIGVKPEFRILVPDEAKIMLHKNLKIHPSLCSRYVETLGVAKDLGITPSAIVAYIEKKKKHDYSDDLKQSLESLQFELNTRHSQKARQNRNEVDSKRDRLKRLSSLLKLQKFVQAWNAYEKLKEKRNVLDYADLNAKALQILRTQKEITEKYDYLIVDEFQDTNRMQFDLLVLLAHHKNITVVGDLNQSIYRFRGAYKENVHMFKHVFGVKASDIYALSKSFRSPNTVLRIANTLIAREPESFALANAYDREGEKIDVYELKNDKEETRKILECIGAEKQRGTPDEEICVMFRTHQQAQRLKRALEEAHVPYAALSKTSLLDLPHIDQLINYLSISNAYSLKKKGASKTWWDLLYSYNLSKEDLAMIGRELKKHEESPHLTEEIMEKLLTLEVSESTKVQLTLVKERILECARLLGEKKPLLDCIDFVRAHQTLPSEQETHDESEKNHTAFKTWIETYLKTESSDLEDVLYHIAVMKKLGIKLETARTEQKGIRLMTHHAAKGLEYTCVIITNMAQNRFPSERTRANELLPSELMPDIAEQLKDTPDYLWDELIESFERSLLLAEERRLCYVACTRAKQRLTLTYATDYGSRTHMPSQFLQEINYTTNPDINFIQDTEEKTISAPELVQADMIETKKPFRSTFSPSALLLFSDCQKKYEYKYIYNMPEPEPTSWEEMRLGSFVHVIIEEGVQNGLVSEEAFITHARMRYTEPEWSSINLDDALSLIRIFYQRNKHKYTRDSLTEIKLKFEIEGITFEGYADRIDIHPEGLEIIDYKTGKGFITAQHRNWQLGIYALAAPRLGKGPVRKMTLDMLRHEKPYEFELLPDGTARDVNAPRTNFNLNTVKEELLATAKKIQECYHKGFTACDLEDNCEFCNQFIWKI